MQNKKEYVSLRSSCTVKRIPFQSCILFSFASTPSSIFPDDFCLFPKKCISFRNNSHILCNVTDCLSVRYPVKKTTYFLLNAAFPGYCAPVPSSSSIRRSWLYFATRSLRLGAPVLIWQVFNATARSAIVLPPPPQAVKLAHIAAASTMLNVLFLILSSSFFIWNTLSAGPFLW